MEPAKQGQSALAGTGAGLLEDYSPWHLDVTVTGT